MVSTRTSSPYFSPNSASAPAAMAWSVGKRRVEVSEFWRITAFTCASMRSSSSGDTGLGWEKSKRSRSAFTSEPFWLTWPPNTRFSAACSKWVAL